MVIEARSAKNRKSLNRQLREKSIKTKKQPFKSSPSSYVTFDSFSPMQTGEELDKLKSGQPSSQGPICKSQFERVSGERKGKIGSSIEETSFRQLQNVINLMDEKTKICIRDSFYRLARSVQQKGSVAITEIQQEFREATKINSRVNISPSYK